MNGRPLLALPTLLLAFAGCDSSVNHEMAHEKKVEATLEAVEAKLAAVEARLARIEEKLPPGKPEDARRDPAAPAASAGGDPKPVR